MPIADIATALHCCRSRGLDCAVLNRLGKLWTLVVACSNTMVISRCHLVSWTVLLSITWPLCVSAVKLDITRDQSGDFFTNPYATSCQDDVDGAFCQITNSSCYRYFPERWDKCCFCHCAAAIGITSTFDESKLVCNKNEDLRKGCTLRLKEWYDEVFLNAIDLSRGSQLGVKDLSFTDHMKFKSCWIWKIEQMTATGYVDSDDQRLFKISGKIHKDKFTLSWSKSDKKYYAKLYRITVRCDLEKGHGKDKIKYSDNLCLVIKSSGTFQMYHPGLPSSSQVSSLSTSSSVSTPTRGQIVPSSSYIIQPSTIIEPSEAVSLAPKLLKPSYSVPGSSLRRAHLSTSQYEVREIRSTSHSSVIPSSVITTSIHVLPSSSHPEEHTIDNIPGSTVSKTRELRETENVKIPVTEMTVIPNPDESRPAVVVTSTVMSQEPEGPHRNEKPSSQKNEKIGTYLGVTLGTVAVVVLVAVLAWFLVFSKRKAEKKHQRTSGTVNAGAAKKGRVYEENFEMKDVDNIYEGVYGDDYEAGTKRTKSGGIENGIFDGLDDLNSYTALNDCRDDESNYEGLISNPKPVVFRDKACKLSFPAALENTADRDPQNKKESFYESADDVGMLTYVDILPEQQEPDRVYSILEEQPDTEVVSPSSKVEQDRVQCSILQEQPGDISSLSGDVEYLVVLSNTTNNKDTGSAGLYADLTGYREENEYQGLVTRKM